MATHKDFKEMYPLSFDLREAVDKANNGEPARLTRYLSGAVSAVSKLRCESSPNRAKSATGLINYYRGLIAHLISLVNDRELRQALETMYIGE